MTHANFLLISGLAQRLYKSTGEHYCVILEKHSTRRYEIARNHDVGIPRIFNAIYSTETSLEYSAYKRSADCKANNVGKPQLVIFNDDICQYVISEISPIGEGRVVVHTAIPSKSNQRGTNETD